MASFESCTHLPVEAYLVERGREILSIAFYVEIYHRRSKHWITLKYEMK